MNGRFVSLLITLCFIFTASGVFAIIPQVKFPEWHKTDIKISDWEPAKGILTLTVQVEANKVPLERIYSQPYLQSSFNTILVRHEKDSLKKGESVNFSHRLNIKSNSENWLEMDVRAMPNISALKSLIKNKHVNNPSMIEVLFSEADEIKSPVFIGTSLPILTRDDIAISVTPEIAFSPEFNFKNQNYYIWLPPDFAESKTTSSAIKLFKTAIQAKDLRKIEASGQNLMERFKVNKHSVAFKKGKDNKFIIPTKIAIEMLEANLLTVKSVLSGKAEDMENSYNNMKPCYTKAFVAYNLGILFKSLNKKEKANKYLKEAIEAQPAWPLAKNQMQ